MESFKRVYSHTIQTESKAGWEVEVTVGVERAQGRDWLWTKMVAVCQGKCQGEERGSHNRLLNPKPPEKEVGN